MPHLSPPLATAARPVRRPVVVFDFDGTVCLGEGPVLAYAEAACDRMEPADAERVRAGFQDWLQGDAAEQHGDAYVALAALARPILGEQLSEAYLDSRRRLVEEDLGVHPPEGLTQLLDDLEAADCERVLLTNAPATGMEHTLAHLGVRTRFDQIVVSARKPSRMPTHLRTLLADQPPHRLASIGDNWTNDVAPAVELGALGLLVTGAWGSSALPPEADAALRAPQLADLAPTLRSFAGDPDAFALATEAATR
ncbi:HAD family hydrolase [Brachybacterium endophyticum]|uniref:HAD family hydrolase n=1 Tax=Brachybacterium endophyticum TaxID=2182385 RepID=UPI001402A884|nr:HAD family hydrolase [Brachybacterium endophyticum]